MPSPASFVRPVLRILLAAALVGVGYAAGYLCGKYRAPFLHTDWSVNIHEWEALPGRPPPDPGDAVPYIESIETYYYTWDGKRVRHGPSIQFEFLPPFRYVLKEQMWSHNYLLRESGGDPTRFEPPLRWKQDAKGE